MNNDLISRKELRKAFKKLPFFTGAYLYYARQLIDNAPTINTTCPHCDSGYAQGYSDGYLKGKEERPTGKWLVTAEDNDGVHRVCCPFCSYEKGSNSIDPIVVTFTKFPKFCENCGADMREEADND